MATVCFDYGHGGKGPGAVGVVGLREKDTDIIIGRKAAAILRNHGVKVVETRTEDKYLSISERANIANRAGVDAFVSFNHNSFDIETANGVETFPHNGSVNGSKLAKFIQDALVNAKLFKTNRGIKTDNFTVLAKTKSPAAFTELGFISNIEDNKVIRTKQDELSLAVARGVLEYLGIKYEGVSSNNVVGRGRSYMIEGDMGPDVKRLQQDLNRLKYNLNVDGSYGPATKKTILDFQKINRLKIDGSDGAEVFNKIKTLLNIKDEAYRVQVGYYNSKSMQRKRQMSLKNKGIKL